MNADEDYGMDVAGFIHVPQVLSAAEVAACNESIDAAGSGAGSFELPALLEHPVLTAYVETLCGSGYVIDKPPTLVADNTGSAVPFSTGTPEDRRRLRYANYHETRECKGLRVFLALSPTSTDGGVVLVTASHNRSTVPPASFIAGADDLGMTEEPKLNSGDLIISAATTLYGVRGRPGRVIEVEFITSRARPTAGFPEIEAPKWATELTPEQRAIVGNRTTGRGATLISDGKKTWVEDAEELPATITLNVDEHS